MAPRSVLITGSNRGIGLEMVRQFAARPEVERIIATCRNMSGATELSALASSSDGRIVILELDVSNMASFPNFAHRVSGVVGDAGLNLLINNAGVLPPQQSLAETTPDAMRHAFEVNCVAPLLLTRELMPLLLKAASAAGAKRPIGVNRAAVVHISSAVGSVAENTSGHLTGGYAYRCSKTALNQAMKTMAVDMAGRGVLVLCIHPGWVQTDMGTSRANITPEHCVKTMLETMERLSEKDHGAFKRFDDTTIPW